MERFADRFDLLLLDDGEPVTIRLEDDSAVTSAVSDTVLSRLRALAIAYDLHVLAHVVVPYEETTLDPRQAEGLVDEFGFLAGTVVDPVVRECVARLTPTALASVRRSVGLVVDWDI